MALNERVLYYGEVYYVVGDAVVAREGEEGITYFIKSLLINKIETTAPRNIQRAMWVSWASVVPFVSGMDYEHSEWWIGVHDGN